MPGGRVLDLLWFGTLRLDDEDIVVVVIEAAPEALSNRGTR